MLSRAAVVQELEDRKLLAANLVVSVAAAPQPNVNAGAPITYTVTVRNVGTDRADNVVLRFDGDDANAFPNDRSTFTSAGQLSGPAFDVDPTVDNEMYRSIGTLNAGLASTFSIVYTVLPTIGENEVLNGVAYVTSDSTAGTITEDDNVTVSTRADLIITKTQINPVGNAVAGLDVTYEITVVNNGPSTANNVTVVDITPADTSFVTVSPEPTGWVYNSLPTVGSAGTFQATKPVMANGESATFTITFHIASDVTGTVFNTATAESTTFDPSFPNQIAVGGPVSVETDLQIVSVSNKDEQTFEGDNQIEYEVAIINKGPSDAVDVSFAWQTPDTGKTQARERVYYTNAVGVAPVTHLSGPEFAIGLPPDPPRRGTITGTLERLQAGVGSTYSFLMATSEDNDLVQTSSITSASPDLVPANNTWTDELHVFDAPLTVQTTPNIQGNDDQELTAEVMVFRDTNNWPGNSQVGAYTTPQGRITEMPDFVGTVNWGDGTAPTPAVITQDFAGDYHVIGAHTYATPGQYPVLVTVTSDGESIAIGNTVAVVGLPPRGGSAVGGLKFTENVSETKKIASFFKGSAAGSTVFNGVINWGDGTPSSPATLTNTGNGLDVIGTHNYVDEGTYTGSVTITGSDGVVNVIPITVVVDDRAVVGSAVTVNAQTGIAATNVVVANFTDPGGAEPVGTYDAIIDWGDGTAPTAGVISFSGGTFTVRGTHTYLTAGTYQTQITVAHGTAPDAVFNGTAIVSDGPINPAVVASPVNVSATTNVSTTAVVATFTDPAGADVVGNYVAIIDWGDTTPTTNGVITYNAGTDTFTVTGTHTYTVAGTYNMTVTIRHGNSPDEIVNPVATVSDASVIDTTTPVSFNGVEGQTLTNVIVGRFTSSNAAATAADFSATINWGDGLPASAGTIVQTGPGAFNVVGTHQFRDDGTFTVAVGVTAGSSGTPTIINSTAVIRDATLRGISRLFNTTRGNAFNGIIGSFIDNNPFDLTASEYQITVDWGDGTATTGATLVRNTTLNQWDIVGTHTFAQASPAGGYKLTITVRDGLSQVRITSTATVV